MKNINEILSGPVSAYTGSEETKSMVEEQVIAKYGKSELRNLDCYHNMRTFNSWLKLGFKVRKGEKAIESITYVETKDANGNVLKRFRRPVFLFYYRQIEPVDHKKSV
ncbi:MAG: hypothetical protein WDK96_01460 [Candidatus Paceibacterota bacterium]|jgi:hypothetical protein